MPALFIGLMSGTSLDGVDGVLADFSNGSARVLQHASAPFPEALRDALLALNSAGDDEIHRGALAGNELARTYAQVVRHLLAQAGLESNAITAIGAHGQTVRHRPLAFDGTGYTIQLNNPALLAELTGIDVVADFRVRDLAAGGQGAPLASAFHRAVFGRPEASDGAVGVLNLGGISNLTVLPADGESVLGFDCGPGNGLMDHWCSAHTGQPYDDGGRWAATGQMLPDLLAKCLAAPYFALPPPKSTGRDLFNPAWLDLQLDGFADANPADVMATLTELTASACADCARRYAKDSAMLIVCGGGALNDHLMERLRRLLPGVQVDSSASHGMPALQVEAAAFAWLARATIRREHGNLASVTGARGGRVLGAIYPA